MSIETWEKEFYPTSALEASGSPLEAARHSLLKWQGLLPVNLKKHSLTLAHRVLYEVVYADPKFSVSTVNCALCLLAERLNGHERLGLCSSCPMHIELGTTCNNKLWSKFAYLNDAQPMVDTLAELVSVLEKKTMAGTIRFVKDVVFRDIEGTILRQYQIGDVVDFQGKTQHYYVTSMGGIWLDEAEEIA